ncbi:MAG: M23 family metallopeptidase [Paracoccaceae bacterium]|nr:M23 family metallopeptidase [Paracoccaceae bacterium]
MPVCTILAALTAAAITGPAPAARGELPYFTRYPDDAYRIVSQFGSSTRIGGGWRAQPNQGIDIIARVRTPVYGVAHGVVVRVAVEPGRGRVVEIATTGAGPAYLTVYTHLHSVEVTEGAPVRAGQRIGTVGDTGTVPRGIAFLHFELLKAGQAVNPEPLFRTRPDGRVQCVDPERAARPPEAGGYAPNRLAEALRGNRDGAPLLYPVACLRE